MKKFLLFFLYYVLAMFLPVFLYVLVAFIWSGGITPNFLALGILLLLPHILFVLLMYYALQGWLLVYKAKRNSVKIGTHNLKDDLKKYFSSDTKDTPYFLLEETEDTLQIFIQNKNQEDQAIERKRYTITFDSDKNIAYGTSQIIRTINGLDSFSVSSSSGVHYSFGSEIKKSYKVEGSEIVFIPENFMYSITDIVDPVRIIINNGGWNFIMTTASSKSLIIRRNILFALSLVSLVAVSFLYSKYTVTLTDFLTDGFVYYK